MPRPPMQRPAAGRWTIGRLMGAIAAIAVALAVVRAGGAVVVILFGVPGSYITVVVLAARYGRRRGRSGLAAGTIVGAAVPTALGLLAAIVSLLVGEPRPSGARDLVLQMVFALVFCLGIALWGAFLGVVVSSVYLCLAELRDGPPGEVPETPGPGCPDEVPS